MVLRRAARAWYDRPRPGLRRRSPARLVAPLVLTVVLLAASAPWLPRPPVVAGRLASYYTPATTRSYYENNANPLRLYSQGGRAGRAAAQGLVVLDFGRPASAGLVDGTMSFTSRFLPFAWVARGVESYILAYYRKAPPGTTLYVAIGTNNSCTYLAPCGVGICGCRDEPTSYFSWGEALAATVEQVGAWSAALRYKRGYSDLVQVVAADDAEPAFDPGFTNTYDVLAGYAAAVGGTQPALVDDGSAEPHYWTEDQLLQVAYGFRPDIPMPQVYFPVQAAEWAALTRYAMRRYHRSVQIFGVMAQDGPSPTAAALAYTNMLRALARTTHQLSIPWLSAIGA